MARKAPIKPRTSTRVTRARPRVSYVEVKDDGMSTDSEDEGSEAEIEPPSEGEDDEEEDQGEPEDEEEEEEEKDFSPSRNKKGRSSVGSSAKGKIKAKKVLSLAGLVALPLDVLASILSAGDLQSLFIISRLNKKFHNFLYSSALTGVWLSCWKNSELPEIDLTKEMNILKWSNVLFGDCEVCGSKSVNIDGHLRVKACMQKCWNKISIHHTKLEPEQLALTPYLASVIPTNGRNNKPYYLLRDFEDATSGLAASKSAIENGDVSGSFTHSRFGSIPLQDFETTLKDLIKKQYEEGDLIEKWVLGQKSKTLDAKAKVNKDRVDDVKARFIKLGFEERHFNTEFHAHKQVRAARPLTSNAWPSVRNVLRPILEASRRVVIDQDLAPIRQARLNSLCNEHEHLRKFPIAAKRAGLFPLQQWDIYFSLDSFRQLYWPADAVVTPTTLRDNGTMLSLEVQIKKMSLFPEFFSKLQTSIGPFEQMYREGGRLESPWLDKWIMDADHTDSEKKDALRSCFGVFTCTRCTHVDAFPKVLNHICRLGDPISTESYPAPLDPTKYEINAREVLHVTSILNAADLSETTFTEREFAPLAQAHEELEKLGNGFSCTGCTPGFESLARDWVGMLNHILKPSHRLSLGYHKGAWPSQPDHIVLETPAEAQLRLLKAHEDLHNDTRGVYNL